MFTRVRPRAVVIVVAALAAVALPTAAAFADTAELPQRPPDAPHLTPRESIQPAAHIVGEMAVKGAERSSGQPLGMLPEQPAPGSQNTESPVSVVKRSSAATPETELPRSSRPGLQTQSVQWPGTTAMMPPPTPLLPGSPTR